MKITQRQLRRIIREAVNDLPPHVTADRPASDFASSKEWAQQFSDPTKILYVETIPYGGVSIEHEVEGPLTLGEMIKSLIDARETDFFHDALGFEELRHAHDNGIQGGMENWDSDVFEQYYSVDVEKMINLYAKKNQLHVVDVPMEAE
tara:strand:- start:622 stop:1065 length:444 start_codon:yes stop_codon:yes gene_type:complete